MEETIRRVQLTGGATYIISLPKNWANKRGVKPGDILLVRELPDGSLLVSPSMKAPSLKDKLTRINVTEDDPDSLARLVVAAYIAGYNTIEVTSLNKGIPPRCVERVKNIIKRTLIGVELVEETMEKLVLQVFIHHVDFPVEKTVQRMASLATHMYLDALKAFKMRNAELLKEIMNRDDEVDRLYMLATRQLTLAIRSPELLHEIGLHELRDCLEFRLVIRHLERVADHAVVVCKSLLEIIRRPVSENLLEELEDYVNNALEALKYSVDAVIGRDVARADQAIKAREKVRMREERLVAEILEKGKFNAREVAALRMILESIRRVSEYSAGIAEIAVNLTTKTPL